MHQRHSDGNERMSDVDSFGEFNDPEAFMKRFTRFLAWNGGARP